MTQRVLITGGAGFIGSHVAEVFVERGWQVEIIDDLSTGKRANVPGAARFHELDVRSREAAAIVASGAFDVLVHLAAQMDVRRSVADPVFDAGVNVVGSLALLEAVRGCARGRDMRVVFASTGGVLYGELASPPNAETTPKEPDSPYAIAKLATEYYLAYYARVHGLNTVCLRFGNVYGPRQDPHGEAGVVAIFCGRILEEKPLIVYGDGQQTRDYVHVADVADATYRASTRPLSLGARMDDRGFNIGTGVGTPVLELAKLLREAAGTGAPIEFAPKRPGEPQHSSIIIDRARRVLGWAPSVSLATGLADTYRWFAARAASALTPRL